MKLKFKLLSFLFFALAFLLVVSPVQAVDEFQTSISSQFEVFLDGRTHVVQNVTLTNNLANIYAQKYTFSIGSTRIENIRAQDQHGAIEPLVEKQANKTEVTLNFNQPAVGKGESQEFSLVFDSWDFAVKKGQVWEVTLPKLSGAKDLNQYQAQLTVPSSFGEPALVSPQYQSTNRQDSKITFSFNSDQIRQQGIAATFGDQQVFKFELKYHLKNPFDHSVRTQIAIPPDTAYQKLYYHKIDPEPQNVLVDSDGNWLAEFELSPQQEVSVKAVGQAQIFLNPQSNQLPKPTQEELNVYLNKQEYWQTDDPQIAAKAKELKDIESIYRFTVDSLIYDYGRIKDDLERQGAAQAIKNPESAICMEFADLFVALARAAGIPARVINGYAYTNNPQIRPLAARQDLLHAWPEYWDKKQQTWIQVDPTWENTTGGVDFFNHFDINHFTFVIQGSSSTQPLPAGAYKQDSNPYSKDVLVEFGSQVKPKTDLSISLKNQPQPYFWQPARSTLLIKNSGNHAIYNPKIKLKSKGVKIINGNNIKVLPPLARQQMSLQHPIKLSLQPQDQTVKFAVKQKTYTASVSIPALVNPTTLPFFLSAGVFILIVIFLFTLIIKTVKKIKRGWKNT